jgi:hypothetical protein
VDNINLEFEFNNFDVQGRIKVSPCAVKWIYKENGEWQKNFSVVGRSFPLYKRAAWLNIYL